MTKLSCVCCLALWGGFVHAYPESQVSALPVFTPDQTRASVYLDDIERVLDIARRGELGRLEPGSLRNAARAYAEIGALLEGHDSALELDNVDRAVLFNKQEQIVEWLGLSSRSRMVCQSVTPLGTRVPRTECLTVAERARRELDAERGTREIQR